MHDPQPERLSFREWLADRLIWRAYRLAPRRFATQASGLVDIYWANLAARGQAFIDATETDAEQGRKEPLS